MPDEERVSARLFCPTGEHAGLEYWIEETATIGSDPDHQIVLSAKGVSKTEANILYDTRRKAYYIESSGSGRGVRLDGVEVTGRTRLRDLNVITFGELDLVFVRVSGVPAQELAAMEETVEMSSPGNAPEPDESGTFLSDVKNVKVPRFSPRQSAASGSSESSRDSKSEGTLAEENSSLSVPRFRSSREEVSGEADTAAGPAMLVIFRPEGDLEYLLEEGRHLIGRSRDCDLRLPHSTVSRRHALFEVDAEKITLKDLDSVNYTFLNERRITSPVAVSPGSRVRFGSVKARILSRGSSDE